MSAPKKTESTAAGDDVTTMQMNKDVSSSSMLHAVPQFTDQVPSAFYLVNATFKMLSDPSALIDDLRPINLHVAAAIAMQSFGLCTSESHIALRIFPEEEATVQALFEVHCSGYEYWIGRGPQRRIVKQACTCNKQNQSCFMCTFSGAKHVVEMDPTPVAACATEPSLARSPIA